MDRLLDGLIDVSIRRRGVVLLLAALLFVVGGWYATRAPLDVLPDFTPPRAVVQTEAPGMDGADVEELVTRPIERALLATPRVSTVRSVSSAGLSVVTLTFEDDVDIYRARQLVSERLGLAAAALPEVVRPPVLAPIAAPIGALLKLCLTSSDPDPVRAARTLRRFAEWTVRPRLVAIPGVSQVTAHGGEVERVEVRPDPRRLAERGVTLDELGAALRESQAIAGAGFVETASQRTFVHDDGRLSMRDVEGTLSELVVRRAQGEAVRLSDVATIVRGDEPRLGAALYDGKPAVYLQITKLPWADTLHTTREVERALAELSRALPEGAALSPPLFRQASFVETSLSAVSRSMLLGSILVVLVLLAFLRSGRLAAISLTAIPLSLIAATAVLVGTGTSINGMTLGGLAIAVGEVVDDAIVDVENVWRRLQENARREQPEPALAVIRAASREVRGSVVYATLIVVLVLVPVLLMGGVAGRIFSPLAQAYMLAIVASLITALTVTPAMCALLLPRLAGAEVQPTRLASFLLDRYARVLRRVVEHPRAVVLGALSLAVLALAALPFVSGGFLPELHEGTLIGEIRALPGTSLDEATRLAGRVTAQARPGPSKHVAARIGRAELDEDAASENRVEMDFVLDPQDDREIEEIVVDLATRIGRVPGLGFAVEGFLGERVHETLSGETAPVVIKIAGPDLARLRELASKVAAIVERTKGLGAASIEPQIDIPTLRVVPDRVALARLGISPAALAEAVSTWRQGRSVTQVLERDGRVVDVVVVGPPELRRRERIEDLLLDRPSGGRVPLGAVAAITPALAPAVIHHEAGERVISVAVSASRAGLSSAATRLEQAMAAELVLPRGYRVTLGGESIERRNAASRLILVGVAVLGSVFILLHIAFRSARDAGIVLVNFPLGLVGGVVAALLSPEGLSVAGFVGFVTLFGIIARNGIMLVAHKRQIDLERPFDDPVERVLRASEERLLPILMTAATAGLGLLPLALSVESAGSEIEAPMAVLVCAGLVSSTTLNMLVLPTIYVWLARRPRPSEAPLQEPVVAS
jgi:CzcA family heavy metal efflux pump